MDLVVVAWVEVDVVCLVELVVAGAVVVIEVVTVLTEVVLAVVVTEVVRVTVVEVVVVADAVVVDVEVVVWTMVSGEVFRLPKATGTNMIVATATVARRPRGTCFVSKMEDLS